MPTGKTTVPFVDTTTVCLIKETKRSPSDNGLCQSMPRFPYLYLLIHCMKWKKKTFAFRKLGYTFFQLNRGEWRIICNFSNIKWPQFSSILFHFSFSLHITHCSLVKGRSNSKNKLDKRKPAQSLRYHFIWILNTSMIFVMYAWN